jgi:hypothetical protein
VGLMSYPAVAGPGAGLIRAGRGPLVSDGPPCIGFGMVTDTPTALFCVAQADAAVLLEDLHPDEPSALYRQLFKQLAAAAGPATEIRLAENQAAPVRRWLDRAKLRYLRKGDRRKAETFARVRQSEVKDLPRESPEHVNPRDRGVLLTAAPARLPVGV